MAHVVENKQRKCYQIAWHDGRKEHRVVVRRVAALPFPRKRPVEVTEQLTRYQRKEQAVRGSREVSRDESVKDFLAGYLADYELTRAGSSAEQVAFAVGRFLEFCAARKVRTVGQVDRKAVDGYAAARASGAVKGKTVGGRGDRASFNTISKEMGLLSGAWSRAVKHGQLEANPWEGAVPPVKAPKAKGSSWTPEEFDRLIEASRPWLRDVLTFGVLTGLRIKAVAGMEWQYVRWAPAGSKGFGVVRVPPHLDKIGAGYDVPIGERCHDLLMRRFAGSGKADRVVTSQAGKPFSAGGYVGTAIHLACKRAGLPRVDSPCHAMRRTFGRWAVTGLLTGRPVPLYVVSQWMGHRQVSQTEHYLDLGAEASQEWMAGPSPAPGTPSATPSC